MISFAFILFTTLCFFGLLANAQFKTPAASRAIYTTVSVLLVLFAALRPLGIDQDSRAYELYYNFDLDTLWLSAEPTFVLITIVAKALAQDNGLFYVFLFYAVFGVALKTIAIKRLTELTWLSLVVYFSTYFLLHEFTQIRAAIASGLLLLAVIPIAERRLVPFLALVTVAILFHYSAMVAIPLYFFSNDKLTKSTKLFLASAIPVGIVFHYLKINPIILIPIDAIRIKLEVYEITESYRGLKLNVFNILYLVRYGVFFVLLYFSELIQTRFKYFPVLIKIYGLSLFSYLALSTNSIVAMRVSELLGIVEVILIPLLYYTFKPRSIAAAFIFVFALASLGINIFVTELIYETARPSW